MPVRSELGAIVLGEEGAESLQGTQWFFQVVRDDIAEIVELAIDAPQLRVGLLQLLRLVVQGTGQPAEFAVSAYLVGDVEEEAAEMQRDIFLRIAREHVDLHTMLRARARAQAEDDVVAFARFQGFVQGTIEIGHVFWMDHVKKRAAVQLRRRTGQELL